MGKVQKIRCVICGLGSLLLLSSPVQAKDLAGVTLSDTQAVEGLSQPLVLNGAGIRYKFFFKVYIGALYLPQKQSDATAILKAGKANRMIMHVLYDDVPKEKLVDAWNEGFANNLNKTELQALESRISSFNQMFSDLKTGDIVLLDYLPGKGTRVTIKGVEKGWIAGADFNRGLLSVWLGKDPVTEELQQALLGIEED